MPVVLFLDATVACQVLVNEELNYILKIFIIYYEMAGKFHERSAEGVVTTSVRKDIRRQGFLA